MNNQPSVCPFIMKAASSNKLISQRSNRLNIFFLEFRIVLQVFRCRTSLHVVQLQTWTTFSFSFCPTIWFVLPELQRQTPTPSSLHGKCPPQISYPNISSKLNNSAQLAEQTHTFTHVNWINELHLTVSVFKPTSSPVTRLHWLTANSRHASRARRVQLKSLQQQPDGVWSVSERPADLNNNTNVSRPPKKKMLESVCRQRRVSVELTAVWLALKRSWKLTSSKDASFQQRHQSLQDSTRQV